MIVIPCPHCGPRNSSEFRHGGESRTRPDPSAATPAQWRSYLYDKENPAGWASEVWYHAFGCRRFVTVERHHTSNEIRAVAGTDDAPATDAGDHADTTGTTTGRLL